MAKRKKNKSSSRVINDLQTELLKRLGNLEEVVKEKKQSKEELEKFYKSNVNKQRGLSISKSWALRKGEINKAFELEKQVNEQKLIVQSARSLYQDSKNELRNVVENREFIVSGSMGNFRIKYEDVFNNNLDKADIIRQDIDRIRKEIDSNKFQKTSSDNRKKSAYSLYMKRLSGLKSIEKETGKNYLTDQENAALKKWSSEKKQLSEKEFINKKTIGQDRLNFDFLDNPKFKLPTKKRKEYITTIQVVGNFINIF